MKRQIQQTAIDCPHQNTCREYKSQGEETKMAGAEPEFLSVPKNLREIQVRRK